MSEPSGPVGQHSRSPEPTWRQNSQPDSRVLRISNPRTGEIREWPEGLSALVNEYDRMSTLCERIAGALGPEIVRRWADADDTLDLPAEVAALRGILAGYRATLAESTQWMV